MIKALFFDIDGTLVSFNTHQIPASTVEAIAEARRRGVKIIIATGRPRVLINNLQALQERGLIDAYVTVNGGYCFVGNEVISHKPLSEQSVHTILNYTSQQGIPCIVVGEDDICCNCFDGQVDELFYQHLKVTVPMPERTPAQAAPSGKKIYQLSAFIDAAHEAVLAPQIADCEIGRWHPAFVDISSGGSTKQKGIDEMLRYFGLSLDETMAFGDGGNDIPMIKHAHIGVAMGNANDQVKAVADFVTNTVDDDGIAHALKHFGVI